MSNKNNKNNENNEQSTGQQLGMDPLKNLSNSLLNNQNSLDFNSIMRAATNLLNNDAILSSLTELSKKSQPQAEPEVPEKEEKQENPELVSLAEQLEKIANDFSEIKNELLAIKEQNENLTKLVKKIYKYYSKNK
ncbi:hypothetical protein ABES02_24220 [Neobacillus pocheonensis]|uniref:hypothetical protein n=1 Tax=Neobacillus pocheonensis TaxID=363869 RepID=UPI003D2C3FCE